MLRLLLKNKDTVTNYCGLFGSVSMISLTTMQSFSFAAPRIVNVLLIATTGLCIGILGWLSGKNPMTYLDYKKQGNNEQD